MQKKIMSLAAAVAMAAMSAMAFTPGNVVVPAPGAAPRTPAEINAAGTAFEAVKSQVTAPSVHIPAFTAAHSAAPLRAQAPAIEGKPNIYGFMYTNNAGLNKGFYRVDPYKGSTTFMWSDYYVSEWNCAHLGGWMREGKLCGINTFQYMGLYLVYAYQELNLETGKIEKFEPIYYNSDYMLSVLNTVAYRDLDDCVYGYGFTGDGSGYSFTKAKATDIADAVSITDVKETQLVSSLCYNSQDDMFYGVNVEGKFVSIDVEGVQEELFPIQITGWSPGTYTAIVYSPADKAYIFNAYNKDGQFVGWYKIDPVAETTTEISRDPQLGLFRYLVTTDDNADSAAPAAAEITAINLPAGALKGSLSVLMPGKTQGGNPLVGTLDWVLMLNGTPIADGEAAAGATVQITVEDLPEGAWTFSLIVSANGLKSVPAISHQWFGPDSPLAPADVKLSKTKVEWTAPTASVHGGYVDFSDIEYTVTINGVKYATTHDTSADIQLPEGQPWNSYTARVTATYKGMASEEGVSNFITFGEAIVPPVHYRPEEVELELMTLINVDGRKDEEGNDRTWFYTEDMGFPSFASGYNGDDWLILPPFRLDNTEMSYIFAMEIGLVHDSDTSGTWELCLGKQPTAEAMTRVIIPETHCLHMRGDEIQEYFAVAEPGVYYLGIHTRTNSVSFHVSDMDLRLSDRPAAVPQSPTGLNAVPGADGALWADVTFTMPLYTAAGTLIPADTQLTAKVTSVSTEPGFPANSHEVTSLTLTGKPGEKMSTRIVTEQNYNNINVAVSSDGLYGRPETVLIYTGVVRPYLVQNLKGEVTEDNLSLVLTWEPPVEGEEEGPIGSSFRYLIYYYADGWQYGDDAGVDVLSYTYTPTTEQMSSHYVGVMAYNAAGLSYHVAGVSATIGRPYELPMQEVFPDQFETYDGMAILRPSSEYQGTYWMMADPAELSPIFANTSHAALIGYRDPDDATTVELKSLLAMPKFSTEGYKDVKFSVTYWSGRFAPKMRLYGTTYGMDEPVLLGELPMGTGWMTSAVTLPASLENRPWVEVRLEADFPNNQLFALISGYGATGTSGVAEASAVAGSIKASAGMLTVQGYEGCALTVADAAGRVVLSRKALGMAETFALAPGFYIVRAGSDVAKVEVQ